MPAQSPAAALSLLDQGDLAAARDLVAQALAMRLEADAARAWARVAEAGGFSLLAVQAWQAVLAGGAQDVEALEALVILHEARGDERRARACQQRLADLGRGARQPAVVEAAEGAPEPLAGEPEPGDLVRFCHRLGGRAGVHARQWWEAGRGGEPGRGGYSPVQSPLSPELVSAHLAGGMTLGVYLVRHDDTVGQLIFDLDARKSAVEAAWGDPERARALRERIHRTGLALLSGLRRAGFDPLLVDSGYKGRHLWCLFPRPVPAAAPRRRPGRDRRPRRAHGALGLGCGSVMERSHIVRLQGSPSGAGRPAGSATSPIGWGRPIQEQLRLQPPPSYGGGAAASAAEGDAGEPQGGPARWCVWFAQCGSHTLCGASRATRSWARHARRPGAPGARAGPANDRRR